MPMYPKTSHPRNLEASSIISPQVDTCHFLKKKAQLKAKLITRLIILQSNNGSSLNVMPKTTLDKLHALDATLKNSPVIVRAFDGSKREVMGEITLPICIGPTTFDITF
ncbi:hypothetical protein CR513_01512, partial [Mucuna pruriens]